MRGIPGVPWQSDGYTIFAEGDEYAQWLGLFFNAALDEASDELGSGALSLRALAQSKWLGIGEFAEGREDASGAVTTIIADRDPRLIGVEDPNLGDAPHRYSRVLSFRFEDSRWRYVGELDGATGWLAEGCSECQYAHWERWESGG